MLPASGALLTVITPPATVHLAGDLSLTVTHWSRFLPSNKTMASEGAAVQVAPGVTTLGSGVHTSVSSGLGCCAKRGAATAKMAAITNIFEFRICIPSDSLAPNRPEKGKAARPPVIG